MDIFRDPIWEGIAAVITIIGAALAIIAFLSPAFRDTLRVLLVNILTKRFLWYTGLITAILAVGVTIGSQFFRKNSPIEIVVLPLYSQVAQVAWNALTEKDYVLAFDLAESCISNFEEDALQAQRVLSIGGEPSFPIGRVEDTNTRSKIYSYGVLHEVAACYIIKGDALLSLNCKDDARQAYLSAQQFVQARVWDPKQEIFWSPAEIAGRKLANLPNEEMSSDSCLFIQDR